MASFYRVWVAEQDAQTADLHRKNHAACLRFAAENRALAADCEARGASGRHRRAGVHK